MREDGAVEFREGEEPEELDRNEMNFMAGFSVSGNERNHLFGNLQGRQFAELSGLSGVDHPADGRAVGWLDYDRDGWLDLVVVNANRPLVQLFRNQVGALASREAAGMLALRFVGANTSARAAKGMSSRDGYGALVDVEVGGRTIHREHRAGEGFASQNSATLHVGLGDHERADGVRVRWPSGKVQRVDNVPRDSLLTVYEDAARSPDGKGFAIAPYRVTKPRVVSGSARKPRLGLAARAGHGRVKVFTSMATWCETCKAELPRFQRLRSEFSKEDVGLYAVAVDENDTRDKLAAYLKQHQPAYQLLTTTSKQVAELERVIRSELRKDGLPASIITDGRGTILEVLWGAPSVSHIRKHL